MTMETTGRPAEHDNRSYNPQILSYLCCCITKQTLHILHINSVPSQNSTLSTSPTCF